MPAYNLHYLWDVAVSELGRTEIPNEKLVTIVEVISVVVGFAVVVLKSVVVCVLGVRVDTVVLVSVMVEVTVLGCRSHWTLAC